MRRVVSFVDFDDPEVVSMTYLFCNDNSSSHYQRHRGVNSALIKIRVLCCDILQSFNFKTYVIDDNNKHNNETPMKSKLLIRTK